MTDTHPERGRLEREAAIEEASFEPEEKTATIWEQVDELFLQAHKLLNDRHTTNVKVIDGKKSRVTDAYYSMDLTRRDGTKRPVDVYLSSARGQDTVRFLFVDKGSDPESVANDDAFLMTRGNIDKAPTVLLFDKDKRGLHDDANHEHDFEIASDIVNGIAVKSENMRTVRQLDRERRRAKFTRWATGLTLLTAASYSHNVIGRPDNPSWAPLGIAEWFVDWNNQPDHKAAGYEDPVVEPFAIDQELPIPFVPGYESEGAPSTWFDSWFNDLYKHNGVKPGLWKIDLTEDSTTTGLIDPNVFGEELSSELGSFACGSLTGEECAEEVDDIIDGVTNQAIETCTRVEIDLTPGTQLFTANEDLEGFTYRYSNGSLRICSPMGFVVDDPDVLIFNR